MTDAPTLRLATPIEPSIAAGSPGDTGPVLTTGEIVDPDAPVATPTGTPALGDAVPLTPELED